MADSKEQIGNGIPDDFFRILYNRTEKTRYSRIWLLGTGLTVIDIPHELFVRTVV